MTHGRNGDARLRAGVTAVLVLLALAAAPAASAHPYLVAATPQGGVVAGSAPNEIRIAFTERLVLAGCSITVRDARGRRVPVGRLRPALGGDGMSVAVRSLPEGIYTIQWVALGDDGHTVGGSYRFGVPGARGQAPPGADRLLATTDEAGAEAAPTEGAVPLTARWLAALALFALLGAAVVLGRVAPGGVRRASWRRLAPAAVGIAFGGTLVEALARAGAATGGLHAGLLTGSTSGLAIIARLTVLLIGAASLVAVPQDRRRRRLGFTALLALWALALDGHVATLRHPLLEGLAMAVHLTAAAVWVGGVISLAVCVRRAALRDAVRGFAPVALPAAGVTIVTGVIAAVREVGRWYFLRWSSYGHLLLIKGGLVVVVLALGALTTLLVRRRRPSSGLLRAEALAGAGVVAVAALLAGTLQGRGQPLPSQRGNLLPGPGLADVATGGPVAQLTVAPARVGLNRVIVALQPAYGPRGSTAPRPPHRVSVAVSCGCGGRTIGVRVPLQPGSGGRDAWWGNVELPLDGVWSAQIEVDGRATLGAPTFTVGERGSPGAPPVTIASVADLSGPDALECRSQEVGSLLSIELMNLVGGVDGRKLTQEVLDDGGDPAVARADALRLAGRHPVAFLSPCGQGASAAIRAVGDRIPTIVADPGVPVTPGRDVFRFAPNPYAEGFASGQYVGRVGLPSVSRATPRRVAAVVSPSIPGDQERVAGLRDALRQFGISLQEFPAAGPGLAARLERLMPANRWLGVYLDGPFGPLAGALRQIGPGLVSRVNPTAILTSSRLAGEEFVEASGDLGREGQIRSVSDVDPTTPAAQTYTNLILQLVGELPSLPGLSGFTAGQALAYGLIGGTDPRTIAARLRAPAVFSRAAIGPWSDRDPAAGTLMFRVLLPSFLTQNLIPVTPGMPGEVTDGQFFPDGDWEQGADSVFTPLPIR